MGKLIPLPAGERLELRREEGGLRHYLAGEPVHAGELLEFQREDGSWALARYEWNFRQLEKPALCLDGERAIWAEPEMRFRWPKKL